MDKQRPKHNSVRVGDKFAVIRPERPLTGDTETDEFSSIVKQLNDDQYHYVVVDLGSIDWISSPGIGALVDAHQRFAKRGGHVLLARMDKRIHNLLIITKLSMLFDAFPTVEAALEAGAKLPAAPPAPPQ